jgi:hypothetical protein
LTLMRHRPESVVAVSEAGFSTYQSNQLSC